ncbi:MAG: peptidoglycan DD-metalloendopeptidase family protein [Ferruginibacter sp.]
MRKFFLTALSFLFLLMSAQAQTREELERQRKQLKEEIEQTQRMLDENKSKTKVGLSDLALKNRQIDYQGRVIDNINRDLNGLNNDIYKSQREINKMNLLLDTLKQEYAKSMVYAYKNRSNYDFLSFIFSAQSFNDAIKRVSYLKSYRNYRQMQGENILRTQELLQQRIADMSVNKQKKKVVLDGQSKEMSELEKQQEQKKEIVDKLKAQNKQLSSFLAAKKKQDNKVKLAINAVIKKAQDEARKAAIAEAERIEKERVKNLAKTTPVTSTTTNPVTKPEKLIKKAPVKQESELINNENRALAAKFESNKGGLPWPVDKGYIMMHYGINDLPDGGRLVNPGVTIGTDIGTPVKAVFAGTVSKVVYVDNMQVVILQHGRYFSSYSNLSSVAVQPGQAVSTGQVLGKAGANDDGVGSIDLLMSSEKGEDNPERWIHK